MVFYAASSSAFFRFLFGSVSWVIVSMFFGCLGCAFCFALSAFGGYCLYGFVCLRAFFLIGGDCMIIYSTAVRLYGDSYDMRDTTSEIPVLMPAAFVVLYYCDVSRAFGKSLRASAQSVVRVPVLVVSRNTKSFRAEITSIVVSCFRVYGAEADSYLLGYKLGNVRLPESRFTKKYKSVYYLSGISSKFEKKFFLLLFERRSDAVKVLKKTLEVFRVILDLLGDDFCFNQTKSIYSKVEYMYNPIALFAQGLAGWKWCRAFVGGLIKGVVDASEVSSDFLIGKDFEIVRWD